MIDARGGLSRRAGALLLALAVPAFAAHGAGVAYVSNQQGGVSVIDLDTLDVKATLDVDAKGPRGIGVSGDGKLLVTANLGDGNISVIDTASGKLLRHVAIGKSPEFVRVLGNTAFVTYEPRNAAVNGAAPPGPPVVPAPAPRAAQTPAGAVREHAADDDEQVPGHIAVVDLTTGRIVLDIVGKPETEGLAFTADGLRMIVTNESDDSLSVIDVATGKLLRSVSVADHGHRPRGIKVSPDGHRYVVTLELSAKMLVLDDDFNVVREVATGKAPYGVSFDRSGKHVFVASNRDRLLQVFDTAGWNKIGEVATGERCWHFSFTPDDLRILLACGRSNEVLVIDPTGPTVVKRIGGLNTPWGVVTYPRSMGSID
jgi:YVTN family beta-propeller protein